jgi:hypothetical protein
MYICRLKFTLCNILLRKPIYPGAIYNEVDLEDDKIWR